MALSLQQNSAAADFDATNNFLTVQADFWISFVIQADGAYEDGDQREQKTDVAPRVSVMARKTDDMEM